MSDDRWWRHPLRDAWNDVIAPIIVGVVEAIPPLERFINWVIDTLTRLLTPGDPNGN